ncbi:hypothetical protein RJ44_19940 [Alteromonas macleodii]|uniref:hypothetical protein n=1 Tax=Alteromonas macleodii TaxID=28108 RepID=UPI000580102C|nr:hypothetical protein [Alteromonas macleodii]KHT53271.1 hypothetical protein RJ44_19940 [Alteromonas macleodii]
MKPLKSFFITTIVFLTLYPSASLAQVANIAAETQNQEEFGVYIQNSKGEDPEVKLSRNYLCHGKGTTYYPLTTSGYRNNFGNVQECVDAGFGLPKKPYATEDIELYTKAAKNVENLLLERVATGRDPALARLSTLNSASSTSNPNTVAPAPTEVVEAIEDAKKAEEEKKEAADFGGFNWNPALVFLSYNGPDYIEDVEIESNAEGGDGTIFVGKKVGTQLALMLEAHYFWDWSRGKYQYGVGPFVSVSLATQQGNSLGSVMGVGAMFGLRQKDVMNMNIGLGYFRDTDFETLRDGLKDGDTTSFTDSSDLIQKRDVGGLMILFSANF